MLPEGHVNVLGIDVPIYAHVTVEEREEIEVLSVKSAKEGFADSRVKYEALRVIVKCRLDRELPAWRSGPFNLSYSSFFNENYVEVEGAISELLQPFYYEVEAKKARRQAEALKAAGSETGLRAIIKAAETTLNPFRRALLELEQAGESKS